jgi:hypothetical protein
LNARQWHFDTGAPQNPVEQETSVIVVLLHVHVKIHSAHYESAAAIIPLIRP